ncbi:hypothetical protein [Corynebacterium mayonis]|uniref:hypothetical protein n=1 Tax=Corynebacterium mayonis TaxID=3062461 RepID=UPI0031402306
MRWQDTVLVGAPFDASFDSGVLSVGCVQLRILSDSGEDVRAVTPEGAAFRLRKVSLTVNRYEASCDGREYEANRTRGSRREIRNAEGSIVARTRAHLDGSLEVDLAGTPAPEVDVGFITWALTYVDTPGRRTKR